MDPANDIYIGIGLVTIILVVLGLRLLINWFFKINKTVSELEETNRLLRKLVNIQVKNHPDYVPEDIEKSETI